MNTNISQQFEKLFLASQQQSMQQSYRQSQANAAAAEAARRGSIGATAEQK